MEQGMMTLEELQAELNSVAAQNLNRLHEKATSKAAVVKGYTYLQVQDVLAGKVLTKTGKPLYDTEAKLIRFHRWVMYQSANFYKAHKDPRTEIFIASVPRNFDEERMQIVTR
jgi:hypothetical protein